MVTVLRPAKFKSHPKIRCGVSTRLGGVSPEPLGMNLSFRVGDVSSNVIENRERFFRTLDIPLNRIAMPGQIHGDTVRSIDLPGEYPECDALVTRVPNVFLCVTIADCVPALLYDPVTGTVAAVHAGWRGTSQMILGKAVSLLVDRYAVDVRTLLAFLGPCASLCCYSVGKEVADAFPPGCVAQRDGRTYVDLKSANTMQLHEAGVPSGNIEVSPYCTISSPDLLHSYRRDGEKSGRMMGVIGLIE